jgi:hypothetical protein
MLREMLLPCCLGATALAACSPFSPDLGPTPYLCAVQEPRCPEDYACLADAVGREVCVETGGVPPEARPDGSTPGFQCAMDGMLEPNNLVSEAYQTDVGIGAPTRQFGPISICPEGDKDHYQINITTANKGIEVISRWDSGTQISCSLLNSAGTSIGNCTPMGDKAVRVCVPNLPVNVYYAVAFSAEGAKNNYRIEMKSIDNCVQ